MEYGAVGLIRIHNNEGLHILHTALAVAVKSNCLKQPVLTHGLSPTPPTPSLVSSAVTGSTHLPYYFHWTDTSQVGCRYALTVLCNIRAVLITFMCTVDIPSCFRLVCQPSQSRSSSSSSSPNRGAGGGRPFMLCNQRHKKVTSYKQQIRQPSDGAIAAINNCKWDPS